MGEKLLQSQELDNQTFLRFLELGSVSANVPLSEQLGLTCPVLSYIQDSSGPESNPKT